MDCHCFEIREGRAFVQLQIRTLKTVSAYRRNGIQESDTVCHTWQFNLIRPRINVFRSFRQGAVQASSGVRGDKLTAVLLREYISK